GPDATETAARRARYAWLVEVQRRHAARYLVTAHHRDDQIETILLRLLRGSAPAGLAGMPARARGGLVRPLLPFTHDELVAYLAGYDSALAVAVLRAAGRRAGLVLGPRRARQLARLAQRSSGRRQSLGGGWAAEVAFDRVRVSRADAREVGDDREVVEVVASDERGRAQFGTFRVVWSAERAPERLARGDWTTWIAGGAWEVRPLRPGDSLVPLGGIGHRPVRRLLMEARVPRSDRAQYPIGARGQTSS